MKKRTLMIIGAATEHMIGIETAKEMGYKVFVTDGNPSSEGFQIADDYRVASTYDYNATLEAAYDYINKGNSIDGVMTLASDVPYTVAYVAKKLNLPGISMESARNASEKIKMKTLFIKYKVPSPKFVVLTNKGELKSAISKLGFPVVIKPADSRGARGVQLVHSQLDIDKAFDIAINFSPEKKVILEEYLSGPQLSTEGFIIDKKAYIPAIFDRNYEFLERFSPFIIENGGEMPSRYSKEYYDEVHDIMRQAALSLGIENGIIKGDLVIHEGKIKIIELAARMSGGFFGTVATRISTGVDLIKINIDLAMGNKIEPSRFEIINNQAAAIRFSFPQPGKLKKVTGLEVIKEHPDCCYAHVFKRGGDTLTDFSSHPDRPAVVVASGKDLASSIKNANSLLDNLEWEYF